MHYAFDDDTPQWLLSPLANSLADEVTVALQSDSFDADCRLHPQYQEYLVIRCILLAVP